MAVLSYIFCLSALIFWDFRWLLAAFTALIGWSWKEGMLEEIRNELLQVMVLEISMYLQNNLHAPTRFEIMTWDKILVFSSGRQNVYFAFQLDRYNEMKLLFKRLKSDMFKRLTAEEYCMLYNKEKGILNR
jgi:hypothetical protein